MNNQNLNIEAAIQAVDELAKRRIADIERRHLGTAAKEMAIRDAELAKRHLRKSVISYDQAIPASIETARRPMHAHQTIKVRCAIGYMANPMQIDVPSDTPTELVDMLGTRADEADRPFRSSLMTSLVLISLEGEAAVETVDFADRQLIEQLQESIATTATWEILLFVMTCSHLPKGNQSEPVAGIVSTYEFLVLDARALTTALQVVAATPGELEESMATYGTTDDLLLTGAGLVCDALDIVARDRLPELCEAIQFQVLSAATDCYRGHTLLIGPPGIGKSRVHKACELLQPVYKQASPGKTTEAGLIGDGRSKKKNRRPGLLPQSHTGALSIEDFNQANAVKNQRLVLALTFVMEGGKVIDSSVSRATYAAETAILIDANRRSDVRRQKSDLTRMDLLVNDIGLPMNLLSRFTYIVEIPRLPEVQLEVALGMVRRKGKRTEAEEAALQHRLRLLRVFLALMRENHRKVVIPEAVREAIGERLMAACNVPTHTFQTLPEFGDFMARFAQQAQTLTEAHARLHNRATATVGDVDAIFPFLWRKMDWLRTILCGAQVEDQMVAACEKGRRMVLRWYLERCMEPTVTALQIRDRLGMRSVSLPVLVEDLRAMLGDPDVEGRFRVVIQKAA